MLNGIIRLINSINGINDKKKIEIVEMSEYFRRFFRMKSESYIRFI